MIKPRPMHCDWIDRTDMPVLGKRQLLMSWPTVFYWTIGAIKANTFCVYCLTRSNRCTKTAISEYKLLSLVAGNYKHRFQCPQPIYTIQYDGRINGISCK